MAAQYRVWVCGCLLARLLAGIVGSNPVGGMDVVTIVSVVLSGRGLCIGLITHPEESY